MQPFISPAVYSELDYRRERIERDMRLSRRHGARRHHLHLPHRHQHLDVVAPYGDARA